MLFAWITEIGIAATDSQRILRDLSLRAKRLKREFPFQNLLSSIVGSTDLLEIACFDHYFHFAEVAGSSAESFRRSIGVQCLDSEELAEADIPEGQIELQTITEILQPTPDLHLFAVAYLKISPVLMLCAPQQKGASGNFLPDAILRETFFAAEPLWSLYREILSASLPHLPEPKLQVAPVLGLDSVEIVVLIQAERLEQIAALSVALRTLRLEDLELTLEAVASSPGADQTTELLGLKYEPQPQVLDAWNQSPLFSGSTTLWGIPLRESSHLNFEVHGYQPQRHDPPRLLAEKALVLTHTKSMPGHPLPLEQLQDHRATTELTEPFILLGQDDFLVVDSNLQKPHEPGNVDLDQLHRHLVSWMAIEPKAEPREKVWPATEVGLHLNLPERLAESNLEIHLHLFDLLKKRLQQAREAHLDRQTERGSLSRRWLQGANRIGLMYSVTGRVINLIRTVLDQLENNIEDFVDLLAPLHGLIESVERPDITPQEALWIISLIQDLVASRGPREDPFRLPNATLAIEGRAGYRLARDAFIALAESLGRYLAPSSQIVFLDSPGDVSSSQLGPFQWIAISMSSVSLHNPMFWPTAHAVAYGRLAQTTFSNLSAIGAGRGLRDIAENIEGLTLDPHERLSHLLQRTGDHLNRLSVGTFLEPFTEAIRRLLDTLLCDLMLRESLTLAGEDPEVTNERFWFVHGPWLMLSIQEHFGNRAPDRITLQSVIIRCILLDYILEGGNQDWEDFASSVIASERGSQSAESSRVHDHLRCLHEDLRIANARWELVMRQIQDALLSKSDNRKPIFATISKWLMFAKRTRETFLLEDSANDQRIRNQLNSYLSDLIQEWKVTPWPPFISGHRADERALASTRLKGAGEALPFISRRGEIFVQDRTGDDYNGQRWYARRTHKLLSDLAEDSRLGRIEKLKHYLNA